jgi:ribosomal protein L11 methyltransferase
MLAVFPEGFEECEAGAEIELAAYTDVAGEERLRQVFGAIASTPVRPGWEDEWRRFHRPVRVGGLWVGPPWEEPASDAIAVVIDPGRAFGTGAHPTTRLCLALLQRIRRTSLLDAGCGSGVLAVAAAKLGFRPVSAVDSDEAAIDETRRNAAANGVRVEARLADALADPLPHATTTVANLAIEFVDPIAERVRSDHLVVSGYLTAEAPTPAGWRRVERLEVEGWAADRFERA